MKTWSPAKWDQARRTKTIELLKEGDMIRNPVHAMKQSAESYALADWVVDELSSRGLKADHPHCCIWFVEKE